MLKTVTTLWPPPPGSVQTGTKTKLGYGPKIIESLNDLHEPAWWTGVRVATVVPMGFYVHLLKGDGTPVIDLATEACTWVQTTHSWVQFPWAIPAGMAKALDMKLEITTIDGSAPFMEVITCFHELPQMPTNDRYLFTDAEGQLLQVWNGKILKDGTPDRGTPPVWRTLHHIVPPPRLLQNWTGDTVFCVHEWDETVSSCA